MNKPTLTQRQVGRLEVATLIRKYVLECRRLETDELETSKLFISRGNLKYFKKASEYKGKIKLLESILKDIENEEF